MRIALLILLSLFLTDVGLAQRVRKVSDRKPAASSNLYVVGYPDHLAGRKMAGGGTYSPTGLTAAHPSLPFGTMLQLTARATGRSVVVTVTDRGAGDRAAMILSQAAMSRLGLPADETGTATVKPWDPKKAPRVEPAPVAERTPEEPQPDPVVEQATKPSPAQPERARQPDPTRPQEPAVQPQPIPGVFSVQLGAYSDKSTAKSVAAKLDNAWIQQATMENRTVHRVFYGRYTDRTAADAWQVRLAQLGFPGYVRTLPPGS